MDDPAMAEATPTDVTDAVASWRQGDVANIRRFAFIADLTAPTTLVSAQYVANTPPPQVGKYRTQIVDVEGLVIMTQTCDVVRSSLDRPFIEVCPLLIVDEATAKKALRRELSQYAAVPWHGPTSVADLDRVMTIEKGMLASAEKLASWTSTQEIVDFQRVIVRRYQRFAFPDDFVEGVRKLREKVKNKHGKPQSAEGRLFSKVLEIRVRAIPDWNSGPYEAEFTFILPTPELPPVPIEHGSDHRVELIRSWLDAKARTATEIAEKIEAEIGGGGAVLSLLWNRLIDSWISQNINPCGKFVGASGDCVNEDEYKYSAYSRSVSLDLEYLSA